MIVWKIGDIFASLPMICFWAILFLRFQEKKYEGKKGFFMLAAVWMALYFAMDLIPGKTFCMEELMKAAIVVGLSFFFAGDDIKGKIRGAGYIYLCILSMDLIVLFAMWMLKFVLTQSQWEYAEILLGKNIYNLLIYLIFIIYKLIQDRKNREHLVFLTIFSCIFAVAQSVFYYYLFLLNTERLTLEIITVITICSVIILGDYGITLLLMENMMKNQRLQNEEEKKMLSKKYEHDYYLLAKEQSDAIKQVSREMQVQLKAVQELMQRHQEGDKEQVKDMLDKLEEEIGQIGRVYYCEDPVLNTILSLKQDEARKVGVEMEIKVDSVAKTEVEDIDLCCIITNLLDNAIESAQKVRKEREDEGETKVSVNIGRRGGYLAMKVANPALSLPQKNKKGHYKTSKKQGVVGEHGRGLGIVDKTVKKYNGQFNLKKEEDEVVVTVFLKEEPASVGA